MPSNLTLALSIGYFIVWSAGLIAYIFLLRSRRNAQFKKLWYNRFMITLGVIMGSFLAAFMLSAKPKGGLVPEIIIAVAIPIITWLNIHNTYFCASCGKRSSTGMLVRKTFHCPNCGYKLR